MKKKKIFISIFCLLILGSLCTIKLTKDKELTTNVMAKIFADPVEVTYINKIEINYDTTKARLSPYYTYNGVRGVFNSNWSVPNDAGYDKGNNNIYFYYCPSGDACTLSDVTGGYQEQVKEDRYHFVNFEIYGKNCDRGEACANDFDSEHLNGIEVWVNGVKRDDAIVSNYNEYWHCVDVYFPLAIDTSSFVESIRVTSDTNYVQKGTSSNFTASVNYYGDGYDAISWSVINSESAGTTINGEGLLSVSNDETATSLTIRATSTKDETVYGKKEITLLDEPLTIDSVTVTPPDKTVVYGGKFQFRVSVTGTANRNVIWSVAGANSLATVIDENGKLTVGDDETATSLTVTATSVADPSKSSSVTVTTRETEYINKIEINYNEEEVIFSTRTTYNDLRNKLKSNWSLSQNASYDKGNDNIFIYYCPGEEVCDGSDMTVGYSTQVLERYTIVEFDIYAKPSDTYDLENKEYDFDSEHLEDIEIWVNGVKRDDAYISYYNSSWRKVDVYVPVTITDGKLAQDLSFYYETYNADYGDDPFVNNIRRNVGEGPITYSSSDESIATVDSEGYVTVKKVGTCTITANALETEEYKAKSIIDCPKGMFSNSK